MRPLDTTHACRQHQNILHNTKLPERFVELNQQWPRCIIRLKLLLHCTTLFNKSYIKFIHISMLSSIQESTEMLLEICGFVFSKWGKDIHIVKKISICCIQRSHIAQLKFRKTREYLEPYFREIFCAILAKRKIKVPLYHRFAN